MWALLASVLTVTYVVSEDENVLLLIVVFLLACILGVLIGRR
jgi:hypothetical protein